MSLARAMQAATTREYDYVTPYVADLDNVVDMDAIANAGLKIGVDPMGGAGIAYWEPIAEMYGLDMEVVNPYVDPTFSLHDGGQRRQNSDGLLVAVRDGEPDRLERSLRHRLWQ